MYNGISCPSPENVKQYAFKLFFEDIVLFKSLFILDKKFFNLIVAKCSSVIESSPVDHVSPILIKTGLRILSNMKLYENPFIINEFVMELRTMYD